MHSLEEQKLQAEIDKIKAETEALKKPGFLKPTSWIPLLTAFAALIGALSQWYSTSDELDNVKLQKDGLVSYNQGLEKKLTEIQDNLQQQLEARLSEITEDGSILNN